MDMSVQGEESWEQQLEVLRLSRKEKSLIVESVMPELTQLLKQATPYMQDEDVTKKTLFGNKIGHLRDGITHKPNQFMDGSTNLGFRSDVYPIAMWSDWGTYRQAPQYWYERKFLQNIDATSLFAKQKQMVNTIMAAKGLSSL